MKRLTKNKLLVALSACILLPFSNPGLSDEAADPPDKTKWVCKLCVISSGWFGEWELGLIYVDDPTPKFADYRGLDDDGFYLKADGNSRYRNAEGFYFDFYSRNLGLDSRSLEMRGGNQGRYELRAGYREIPRYLGYGTVTPYLGVGTDTLVLPNDWNLSNGNAFMNPASLESKRKTLDAGATIKLGSSWRILANYERQTRDGTYTFGGGVFPFNGVVLPAPLDYTTNLFDVGLEYAGNRGQARLEFSGSDFDNGYNSVTWDSPFARGFGDEVSRSALAPDNKYHQLSLAGAFRFSTRFRVSGKAYIGKAKQNVAFLPYSTNPRFDDLELPRTSLNGKLDTSMYNLSGRMYLRLADGLDLTAQYKKDERDNKTPMDSYTPVLMDVVETGPFSNRPYSYDRQQSWGELRYRPIRNIRINAGLKRATLERTYQEVRKNTEDSYWAEMQFTPWAWLDARLKYENLDRDSTTHEQQGNYGRDEHPLMRKYNMADRNRDRVTIEFDLSPIDRLAVNMSYYQTDDEYSESTVGLTDGKESSVNLDLNYAVGKNSTAYAFFSKERIKSTISGSPNVSTGRWTSFTDDKIISWGLGISGRINDKTSYGLDYVYSDAKGNIRTETSAGQPPFPELLSKLRTTRVYMNHKFNDRWGLGLNLLQEKYDSSDWYVDGFGPLDVNGLMSLGEISPNYNVWSASLFATLNF
jgi:MtrB/PioB family decaheme-associated outer membrane protein